MEKKKETERSVQIQFRTMYDLKGYDDSEINSKESITDPSGYIPTEQLIARFTRGEVVAMGNTEGYYEHEGDYTDLRSNDEAYQAHEAELNAQQEFSQKGEEAIAVEQKARIQKIKQSKASKPHDKGVKASELPKGNSSEETPKAAPK